jgi:hypothetical protein
MSLRASPTLFLARIKPLYTAINQRATTAKPASTRYNADIYNVLMNNIIDRLTAFENAIAYRAIGFFA